MFRRVLQWKLRMLARLMLKRFHPIVVGVTGSVGKTSTKEAIYTVLASKFRTGKNLKNYNNELGVPLAILGEESGKSNPFSWLGIFLRGIGRLIFGDARYPHVLVLEMGADKTGDIQYLTKLAPCTVGVVTAISGVHLEFFGTIERVISEKRKIVTHLKKDGFAILNADDDDVAAMREKTRAQVITYGFNEHADIRALEPSLSKGPHSAHDDHEKMEIRGISYKMSYKGSIIPVFLPSVLGRHQVYAGLAAGAVGIALGLNLHEIADALQDFTSPPGRMNYLPGIKKIGIIDDSYNSSPAAALAALDALKQFPAEGRKIAALGDMAELGDATVEGHTHVGRYAAEIGVDMLVTVGEKAKIIAQTAEEAGLPKDRISIFDHPETAGKFIQREAKENDVVLVKGSQVARMEKIVKELMAEPLLAEKLLVRQGREWM